MFLSVRRITNINIDKLKCINTDGKFGHAELHMYKFIWFGARGTRRNVLRIHIVLHAFLQADVYLHPHDIIDKCATSPE
jgi:hypothetical protein